MGRPNGTFPLERGAWAASTGFGEDGCGPLEYSLRWDSTVYDKGHVHWSLAAQDVLVLPLNNRVTSASYLTLFCGPVCLCVKS